MSDGNGLGELAAALVKAQAAFPKILKDQTAKVQTRSGGEYEYHYADLANLLEAVRPALTANGLVLVQPIELTERGHVLHTMLLHTSGAHLDSYMAIHDYDRIQETGSDITYKRRYCVASMVGVASEEDDDGKAANNSGGRGKSRAAGPVIKARPEDIGNPDRKDPPTTDAEVAQAFPPGIEGEVPDARPLYEQGIRECPACHQPTLRKGAKQYGGGVYCNKNDGGCGMKWRGGFESVQTKVVASGVVEEESEAATEERIALLDQATLLGDALDFSKAQRKQHWATYCGEGRPETVDLAAMKQLVDWLKTRAEAKGLDVKALLA